MSVKQDVRQPAPLERTYQKDESFGYWVPTDGLAAWDYSDGTEVEAKLLRIVAGAGDRSVLSSELAAHCEDWVTRYHLSPVRSNLLRPLNNELSGRVLEVGAGCGALTRFIASTASQVIALEPSAARAAVAAARCRDQEHVGVFVDSLESFASAEKFDAVTLVGVLEYASRFGGPGAASRWLRRCSELLRDDGVIVLAIENQLGLKYFSGALEDHASIAMHGVGDVYQPNETRTFGKHELEQMLHSVGFNQISVCVPLPDYKFPHSILFPAAFDAEGFDYAELCAATVISDPQQPVPPLFAIDRTWKVLARNKVVPDFANSFLLVGSKSLERRLMPLAPKGRALAAHYAADRLPCFTKETIFFELERGGIQVARRQLGPPPPAGGPLRQVVRDEHYVRGVNWAAALSDVVTRAGWTADDLASWASRWLREIEACLTTEVDASCRSAGYLPGRCVDYLPQNLVVGSDSAQFIDKEWTWHEPIAYDVLAFRGVFHSLRRLPAVARPASRELELIATACLRCLDAIGVPPRGSLCADFLKLEESLHIAAHGTWQPVTVDALLQSRLPLFPKVADFLRQASQGDEYGNQLGADVGTALEETKAESLSRLVRIQQLEGRLEATDLALEQTKRQAVERIDLILTLQKRVEATDEALEVTKAQAIERLQIIKALEERLSKTDAALEEAKGHALERLGLMGKLQARIEETDRALETAKALSVERLSRLEGLQMVLEETKEQSLQRLAIIKGLESRLEATHIGLEETKTQSLERLARIASLEVRVGQAEDALDATKAISLDRLARIDALEKRISDVQSEAIAAHAELARMQELETALQAALNSAQADLSRAEAMIAERDAELTELNAAHCAKVAAVQSLEERLHYADMRYAEEAQRLGSVEAERRRLEVLLHDCQTKNVALLNSRSWRYTAPLRKGLDLVRRLRRNGSSGFR